MALYRNKPVVIEAEQFDGTYKSARRIGAWINSYELAAHVQGDPAGDFKFVIHTLEGKMTVSPGDYVIKGVLHEFYPCKPDIFEATYEPVEEDVVKDSFVSGFLDGRPV